MRTTENTSTEPPIRPRPAPNRIRILRVPRFGLSATQLIATGLAAITATFAASYFGVTGTVVGAALVSVVTAAGKEVYSQSLRGTATVARAVVPVTRSLPRVPSGPSQPPEPTGQPSHEATGTAEVDGPPVLPAHASRPGLPNHWRRIALGTLAVFVAVLAVVTGVEVVAGRPVSDLVRGERGAGTSFFGNAQVKTKTVPPTAPTVTMTVTPKVVVTTPTVTQTAPPSTTTTTPSTTPSKSGTPGTSTSPGTPSDTGSSATTPAR